MNFMKEEVFERLFPTDSFWYTLCENYSCTLNHRDSSHASFYDHPEILCHILYVSAWNH